MKYLVSQFKLLSYKVETQEKYKKKSLHFHHSSFKPFNPRAFNKHGRGFHVLRHILMANISPVSTSKDCYLILIAAEGKNTETNLLLMEIRITNYVSFFDIKVNIIQQSNPNMRIRKCLKKILAKRPFDP